MTAWRAAVLGGREAVAGTDAMKPRQEAKLWQLTLLRVVQAARPVDGHVRVPVVEPHGAVNGRARVALTEGEEVGEDGAVGELACISQGKEKGWYVRQRLKGGCGSQSSTGQLL